MSTDRRLRFAIPKKGRLKEDFANLLQTSGLTPRKQNDRHDYALTTDRQNNIAPFETLYQRGGDAMANMQEGLVDMTVVGLDKYEETRNAAGENFNLKIAANFNGCSQCALWIATPDNNLIEDAKNLAGKRIATSYPNILRQWLNRNQIDDVQIIAREGGIEDYVRMGMADAVCDIVESGNTLTANGLTKTIKLFDSHAVLVARQDLDNSQPLTEQAALLSRRLVKSWEDLSTPARHPVQTPTTTTVWQPAYA